MKADWQTRKMVVLSNVYQICGSYHLNYKTDSENTMAISITYYKYSFQYLKRLANRSHINQKLERSKCLKME